MIKKTFLKNSIKFRLIFLVYDYFKKDSGISNWYRNLITELQKSNQFEIHLITNANDDEHYFEKGIWYWLLKIQHYDPNLRVPNLAEIPTSLSNICYTFYDKVKHIQFHSKIDFIVSPIWDVIGLAVFRDKSLKTITTLHTTFLISKPFNPLWLQNKDYMINHVNKIIDAEYEILSDSKFLLSNSATINKKIKELYNIDIHDRSRVISHGIAPAETKSKKIDLNKLDIIIFGRIELRKGIDIVVNKLEKILENSRVNSLIFIGDHTDKKIVSSLFEKISHFDENNKKKVTITQYLYEQDLKEYLTQSDIVVIPSRFESFGLTVIESMNYENIVLASDISAFQEIIDHQIDGWLFESENADDFLVQFNKILNLNLNSFMKIQFAAKQKIKNMFSIEKNTREFIDYLNFIDIK